MTVRLSPTESEVTQPPPPTPQPKPRDAPVASDPSAQVGTRRAIRDARHHRRRTALLCALVIAVCLGLTVLAVELARYRPPPAAAGPSRPPAVRPVPARTSDPLPVGVTAPEGANP